jgi:AI-2 transport protein TqsA
MSTVKFPFYARLALTLFAIVLIFLILSAAKTIFIPLVFSLLISILLYPVNVFFERKLRLGRVAGAILSVILFIAALTGFIYFISIELVGFSYDLPVIRMRFLQMFDSIQLWLSNKLHITGSQQIEYMNRSITGMLESTAHAASNILVSVTDVLLVMVFVIIFTFFMLYHRKLLMRFLLHLFKVSDRGKVSEVIMETRTMINAYVLGLMIEMVIISIVNSTLLVVMGVPFALLLGVMTAVLNIIPYLGFYFSIIVCMVITFANHTGSLALEAGLGLFIVHLIDSNFLMPRIIGARVKMNPFITIIAVIVGEFIWGIPGMFLFIPVTGMVKLICERVESLEAWSILIGVDDEEKPKGKMKMDSL